MDIVIGQTVSLDQLRTWCVSMAWSGCLMGSTYRVVDRRTCAYKMRCIAHGIGVRLVAAPGGWIMVDRKFWEAKT